MSDVLLHILSDIKQQHGIIYEYVINDEMLLE